MRIMVYNTLTRRKEEFIPREKGKVGIYVCGITPYDYAHIGNARPPVVWDVIRRFLRSCGYKVFMVQNVTDVDDKIIRRAQQEGCSPLELSAKYARIYFEDLAALGVEEPDVRPKVSEHIPEIVAMVEQLVNKGHAYEVEGDVYFAVESFPEYGKLSGRSLDEMTAGARVEVDTRKRHPMDFALWKAAKPGEPAWDSPWGKGRPGWHIECSTMSLKYLQPGFDFHGGGADLVFPHHENEIAQSEAATGSKPFVRYWLHTGFITTGGDKMSKSLGNIVTIRQVMEDFSPLAVRFWLLGTHYRNPLSFGQQELQSAARGLERLETAEANWRRLLGEKPVKQQEKEAGRLRQVVKESRERFFEAMRDDFNTATALGSLYEMVREVNKWCLSREFQMTGEGREVLAEALAVLEEEGEILGIRRKETVQALDEQEIKEMLARRRQARAEKNYALADQIREELKNRGIIIEDTPQGTRWRRG